MWAAYLMGIDRILMAFLAEPETAEIVLDKVLDCNLQIVRRAIRAGAEVFNNAECFPLLLQKESAWRAAPMNRGIAGTGILPLHVAQLWPISSRQTARIATGGSVAGRATARVGSANFRPGVASTLYFAAYGYSVIIIL